MFGFLNIDKPAGWTSRDVVNRVQRLVRPLKAGHAGTLDPLATGVLVIAVGPATRLIEMVQRLPKQYAATFLLGRESDTEDVEGDVRRLPDAQPPSRSAIEAVLPEFIGQIQQVPPVYSALKVAGQRAYELARGGQAVDLPPRPVVIHDVKLVNYDFPEFRLDITCGSGTYIRSLGRDIARRLGTGAVMSQLRRTAIGVYSASDAINVDELNAASIGANLLPARTAVESLSTIVVTDDEARRLLQGQRIPNRFGTRAEEIAIVDDRGQLIAIAGCVDGSQLKTLRGFPS